VTPQRIVTATAPTHRGGRPRRQVALTAPTLQPLLEGEHQDAFRALSSLLLDADLGVPTETVDSTSAGAAAPRDPRSPTAAILDTLSRPGAKMPSQPSPRASAA